MKVKYSRSRKKQRQNSGKILVLGPPCVYQDLSTCQDWTVKNAIVHLPIMLKGNSKCR